MKKLERTQFNGKINSEAIRYAVCGVALVGGLITFNYVESKAIFSNVNNFFKNDVQTTIEKNIEQPSSDLLLAAEKIDTANSINYFMNSLYNVEEVYGKIYSNATNKDVEVIDPSYEEFKESVNRTINNLYEFKGNNYQADDAEELTRISNQLYYDYNVISEYTANNKFKDYKELIDKSVEYKLKECLDAQGYSDVTLNDITFKEAIIEEKTYSQIGPNKYYRASFDLDVDGDNYVFDSGYFLSRSMDYDSKGPIDKRIDYILSDDYVFDFDNLTIRDLEYERQDRIFNAFHYYIMPLLLASGYVLVAARVKKDDKVIIKKK